ncbi:tyrosine-type recombinase/integrase [Methylobacterium currus]|uniref:tyrosine-type recombinase/integrase n=1 Tax=Methylobacterium currus TaxID=2051553 RepID=UPI002F26C079
MPAARALAASLAGGPAPGDHDPGHAPGTPWAKRRFHEAWSETAAAAGITALHFHDLRGTAVTMLAEAGCTVPEIATITGHSQAHAQRILDRYLARTRTLAESAIAKLDEHRRNQPERTPTLGQGRYSTSLTL